MEQEEFYICKKDFYPFKADKKTEPYAKKGDVVRLISNRGNVLIVEAKNKKRFSVKVEEVKLKQ